MDFKQFYNSLLLLYVGSLIIYDSTLNCLLSNVVGKSISSSGYRIKPEIVVRLISTI